MNCPSCTKKINPKALKCPFCKTLLVSEEVYNKRISKNKENAKKAKQRDYVKQGRNILFIIGGLNALGIILYLVQEDQLSAIIQGVVASIFLLLGFLSIKNPYAAILTGIIVYALLITLSAVADPGSIIKGLLLKGIIIYYLIKGLKAAKSHRAIKANEELLDDVLL